ncbi:response regulator transcription factor [Clostridium chauvoei]|uniref:Stage 0 sporulation protein A homolog n=2 Tax=Clostridium chauvoei TaxID=46867 RepID=S6EQA9_9CLOT|nr:response regulator transcription factor [Clostridium chauvoei]ATD54792.1 DNA-binding response regulator [Clostridium chauvoei]ATD57527.1 DNA-binding response regulator [Clostridium chauvoei]MBX7281765.1 response regulator transcription factor [Clostridium chauvoei]MBX7284268.1 response regulator transcription factor [Clostridium chauvoei]MBX7286804.1 response regulator transcription factor [Clostridium chauvoei]
MANILIVDDEKSIRDLIVLTLELENYTTMEASNGEIALNLINKFNFDLILLDIMLPKMDGIKLFQEIKHKKIPVIFLTAKCSLQDKILGLKLGAEDYITKPFEPLELLARIEVILRRKNNYYSDNNILKFKNITILTNERIVKNNDNEVSLTVKEYNLLVEFIKNTNIVLSRECLLDKVWGYDFYGETRTVDMHVKQLREKLNLKNNLITVYKIGYKLKE